MKTPYIQPRTEANDILMRTSILTGSPESVTPDNIQTGDYNPLDGPITII